jgi:hypothetical protein
MWVEHLDKGRLELNYLTFNALTTGRAFTVFLDEDRRLFNDFSEIINYEQKFKQSFRRFHKHAENQDGRATRKDPARPKKALVEGLNNRLCSLILERKSPIKPNL